MRNPPVIQIVTKYPNSHTYSSSHRFSYENVTIWRQYFFSWQNFGLRRMIPRKWDWIYFLFLQRWMRFCWNYYLKLFEHSLDDKFRTYWTENFSRPTTSVAPPDVRFFVYRIGHRTWRKRRRNSIPVWTWKVSTGNSQKIKVETEIFFDAKNESRFKNGDTKRWGRRNCQKTKRIGRTRLQCLKTNLTNKILITVKWTEMRPLNR